jgi:hypothetical protein
MNTFTNSNVDPREPMQKAFEEDCANTGLKFDMSTAYTYLYGPTLQAFRVYRLGYERSVKDHK